MMNDMSCDSLVSRGSRVRRQMLATNMQSNRKCISIPPSASSVTSSNETLFTLNLSHQITSNQMTINRNSSTCDMLHDSSSPTLVTPLTYCPPSLVGGKSHSSQFHIKYMNHSSRWFESRGAILCLLASLALLAAVFITPTQSAPSHNSYGRYRSPKEKGCYYLLKHYNNGEQIETDEPCLNCTCVNSMLMCYLRVCPFVRPLAERCIIEKVKGECCPRIICPDIPDPEPELETESPSTTTTTEAPYEGAGCWLNDKFYREGQQLPPDTDKPCETCYCVRNTSACVMQDCALEVSGCNAVYRAGSCCPTRYNCSSEAATTVPPSERLQTSGCYLNGRYLADGEAVPSKNPCEHCYCLRNEVVCAVQECKPPCDGCRPIEDPNKPEQCCPERWECDSTTKHVPTDNILLANMSTTESKIDADITTTTSSPFLISSSTSAAQFTDKLSTKTSLLTTLGLASHQSDAATTTELPSEMAITGKSQELTTMADSQELSGSSTGPSKDSLTHTSVSESQSTSLHDGSSSSVTSAAPTMGPRLDIGSSLESNDDKIVNDQPTELPQLSPTTLSSIVDDELQSVGQLVGKSEMVTTTRSPVSESPKPEIHSSSTIDQLRPLDSREQELEPSTTAAPQEVTSHDIYDHDHDDNEVIGVATVTEKLSDGLLKQEKVLASSSAPPTTGSSASPSSSLLLDTTASPTPSSDIDDETTTSSSSQTSEGAFSSTVELSNPTAPIAKAPQVTTEEAIVEQELTTQAAPSVSNKELTSSVSSETHDLPLNASTESYSKSTGSVSTSEELHSEEPQSTEPSLASSSVPEITMSSTESSRLSEPRLETSSESHHAVPTGDDEEEEEPHHRLPDKPMEYEDEDFEPVSSSTRPPLRPRPTQGHESSSSTVSSESLTESIMAIAMGMIGKSPVDGVSPGVSLKPLTPKKTDDIPLFPRKPLISDGMVRIPGEGVSMGGGGVTTRKPSSPKRPPVIPLIPGEGICRHNNRIYQNGDEVESDDPCMELCMCIASVVYCDEVVCDNNAPTSANGSCVAYRDPNECCTQYECHDEEPVAAPGVASSTVAPQVISSTTATATPSTKQPSSTSQAETFAQTSSTTQVLASQSTTSQEETSTAASNSEETSSTVKTISTSPAASSSSSGSSIGAEIHMPTQASPVEIQDLLTTQMPQADSKSKEVDDVRPAETVSTTESSELLESSSQSVTPVTSKQAAIEDVAELTTIASLISSSPKSVDAKEAVPSVVDSEIPTTTAAPILKDVFSLVVKETDSPQTTTELVISEESTSPSSQAFAGSSTEEPIVLSSELPPSKVEIQDEDQLSPTSTSLPEIIRVKGLPDTSLLSESISTEDVTAGPSTSAPIDIKDIDTYSTMSSNEPDEKFDSLGESKLTVELSTQAAMGTTSAEVQDVPTTQIAHQAPGADDKANKSPTQAPSTAEFDGLSDVSSTPAIPVTSTQASSISHKEDPAVESTTSEPPMASMPETESVKEESPSPATFDANKSVTTNSIHEETGVPKISSLVTEQYTKTTVSPQIRISEQAEATTPVPFQDEAVLPMTTSSPVMISVKGISEVSVGLSQGITSMLSTMAPSELKGVVLSGDDIAEESTTQVPDQQEVTSSTSVSSSTSSHEESEVTSTQETQSISSTSKTALKESSLLPTTSGLVALSEDDITTPSAGTELDSSQESKFFKELTTESSVKTTSSDAQDIPTTQSTRVVSESVEPIRSSTYEPKELDTSSISPTTVSSLASVKDEERSETTRLPLSSSVSPIVDAEISSVTSSPIQSSPEEGDVVETTQGPQVSVERTATEESTEARLDSTTISTLSPMIISEISKSTPHLETKIQDETLAETTTSYSPVKLPVKDVPEVSVVTGEEGTVTTSTVAPIGLKGTDSKEDLAHELTTQLLDEQVVTSSSTSALPIYPDESEENATPMPEVQTISGIKTSETSSVAPSVSSDLPVDSVVSGDEASAAASTLAPSDLAQADATTIRPSTSSSVKDKAVDPSEESKQEMTTVIPNQQAFSTSSSALSSSESVESVESSTHLPEAQSASTDSSDKSSSITTTPVLWTAQPTTAASVAESSSAIAISSSTESGGIGSTETDIAAMERLATTLSSMGFNLSSSTVLSPSSTTPIPSSAEQFSPVASPSSTVMPPPTTSAALLEDELEDGACVFNGKVFQSAEQIPRPHPCDFCFCFRGDIICLQQTCPPPIPRCFETPIEGFCCPRYECPVQVTTSNRTLTSTTPRPPSRDQEDNKEVRGCEIQGKFYEVGSLVKPASGPCLQCMCDSSGVMKCNPQSCAPQAPLLLRMNRQFFSNDTLAGALRRRR